MPKSFFPAILVTVSILALDSFASNEPTHIPNEFDVASIDQTVSPRDDFYRFAAGAWIDNAVIPAKRSQWGALDVKDQNNEFLIHGLLNHFILKAKAEPGSAQAKIRDFYQTAMDTAAIDEAGNRPISSEIRRIGGISSLISVYEYLGHANLGLGSTLVDFSVAPDPDDIETAVIHFKPGRLSLPYLVYYLDRNYASYLQQFESHILQMLMLTGESASAATAYAQEIVAFETKVATIMQNSADTDETEAVSSQRRFSEVMDLMGDFDFSTYFSSLGANIYRDAYRVHEIEYFRQLGSLFKETPSSQIARYFVWRTLNNAAPYLASDYAWEHFHFYSITLNDDSRQSPRWKRVAHEVDTTLGFAFGQLFVTKLRSRYSLRYLEEMVENLREELAQRIPTVDWMDAATKEKTLEKLASMRIDLGYPRKERDYSELNITTAGFYQNMVAGARFESARQIAQLDSSYDPFTWPQSPLQTEVTYRPVLNQLIIPAGLLQAPHFSLDLDKSIDYGTIGALIAREMIRALNLFDSPSEALETRTQILVDQYNAYEILAGTHVDGEATLTENLIDLGGLSLALAAWKHTRYSNSPTTFDGFTRLQQFFLASAQQWRIKYQIGSLERAVLMDEIDIPARFRAIGPIVHLPEFHEAFETAEGDPMWRDPASRVRLW